MNRHPFSLTLILSATFLIALSYLVPYYQASAGRAGFRASNAHGLTGALSSAAILYSQPPDPNGGLLQSSKNVAGGDLDEYVWDNFTLQSSQVITVTEVQWRGGYNPALAGSGTVDDFTVAIYASIPAGTQPDIINPPLVSYQAGGNAGQTLAGIFGGVTLYDYDFILPTPFRVTPGTKYWLQVEAIQTVPDWCLTYGTGGDNNHFMRFYNLGDAHYLSLPHDAAFTLLGYASRVYLPEVQK